MRRAGPLRDRLLNHVQVDSDTGCWNWTAQTDRDGYGRISALGSNAAHRVSWEEFRGAIPAGLVLDHLCRNRRCVNPDHLEPVTQLVNNRRGTSVAVDNALKTHCQRGHMYDDQNTRVWRGSRHCRECNRIACEKYAAKRSASATLSSAPANA